VFADKGRLGFRRAVAFWWNTTHSLLPPLCATHFKLWPLCIVESGLDLCCRLLLSTAMHHEQGSFSFGPTCSHSPGEDPEAPFQNYGAIDLLALEPVCNLVPLG
jgi:hypothetical protein